MELFGTLAPLIYDAMGWGKISVGFPWFNSMFVALMPFLALLMGVGVNTRWKRNGASELFRQLWLAAAASITVGVLVLFASDIKDNLYVALGLLLAAWLLLSHIVNMRDRYRHKGFTAVFTDLAGKGRSYYGMWLAHVGVAMFIVGITMVSNYGIEQDIRMSPGDSQEMEGYTFVFQGVNRYRGPNYVADQGKFQVLKDGRQVAFLEPEKRTYLVQTRPMTEAAIDPSLTRDLYVSLGESVGGGDWAVRLYYKPYVRWIWLGSIFMALGGLVSVSDRRYRSLRPRKQAPVSTGPATAT